MVPPVTAKYDWILALITIAFLASSFGNGANDVANSYATSVAARTLTLWQAGILSICTEFIGAVALGARVTNTIKSSIIDIKRFNGNPAVLMLAMACAEFGSAGWLLLSTCWGFPVSTTQTIIGALCGVGIAAQANISWEWKKGSVSQVAASWGVSPLIAAGFSALIFGILKYSVLERKDPLKWAMRLVPFYLAVTGAILALFITIEAPGVGGELEDFGAGKITGIILGVFFGCLLMAYVFFLPYFHRRVIKGDARIRVWHLPLGPLLWKEDPWVPYPGKGDVAVKNYYEDAHGNVRAGRYAAEKADQLDPIDPVTTNDSTKSAQIDTDVEQIPVTAVVSSGKKPERKGPVEPYERFIQPVKHLSWFSPAKWWGYFKFGFLQGVTREVVTHDEAVLQAVHSRARLYDNRVEHMWTYCQVISAMMMSIAHGSNDVANAVGPWAATYSTYISGAVDVKSPTPTWILVVAGLMLGIGFWFYGYHIVRALGNKITQMSPTRGFSIELGAAITVMLASRLGLPVSTTQCLTGSALGVALMNYDLGAVNWRQLLYIFSGWVLTLPCAGLVSGLLLVMALNTPHF